MRRCALTDLNAIGDEFADEIKSAANDLSNSLPLSVPQLRSAFTDDQIKDLHAMIKEIDAASNENDKKARLIEHAGTALNLLKRLGVGI